jgi:hypothetical protein
MVSKNGVAIVVMILGMLGADVSESDLSTTIGVIMQVVSLIVMMWNQYARKDTTGFIFKK